VAVKNTFGLLNVNPVTEKKFTKNIAIVIKGIKPDRLVQRIEMFVSGNLPVFAIVVPSIELLEVFAQRNIGYVEEWKGQELPMVLMVIMALMA